jgi:hypothetical protein
MKIAKIRIKDFQQFKDIELDFTHPETGEPLDKICSDWLIINELGRKNGVNTEESIFFLL